MPIVLVGLVFISVMMLSRGALGSSENMSKKRNWDLDDIEPENQGGSLKTDYDIIFEKYADKYDVPFALLKAHAYRESSLKPTAFMDENPSKRSDRVGWASRGLMQTLWWPKSQRFKKYGYPDEILSNGEAIFRPEVSIDIGAQIIRDNLKACDGVLRDAINMYNTGKKEAQYQAPNDYVGKVLSTYNLLINKG